MSAYRKGHSCETALLKLVEDWKLAVDNGETVGIVSTDTSKAFDSLLPALLLNKLKAYNFSEKALSLIRSYLKHRKARVKLGAIRSNWQNIKRGCPQGSCFGPLLWNIFQNDQTFSITNYCLSMYADDHQLYSSSGLTSEVEKTLTDQAQAAANWYNRNFLMVNKEKFQALIIKRKGKENEIIDIKVDNENIEQTSLLKLLGVNIDKYLNFIDHIKHISTKANQKVGVLSRLRNLIPEKAKLQLFKSSILPHLTYCSLVWHFIRSSDKRKLERIQEKGLRIVHNDHQNSYIHLLTKAKLPSLYNRRLQDLAILMFKVKYGISPSYILDLFKHHDSGHNLRNADFVIPRFKTVTYGKHSIRYLGPHLWKMLPISLKNITDLKQFKHKIRNEDLTKLDTGQKCATNCYLCNS